MSDTRPPEGEQQPGVRRPITPEPRHSSAALGSVTPAEPGTPLRPYVEPERRKRGVDSVFLAIGIVAPLVLNSVMGYVFGIITGTSSTGAGIAYAVPIVVDVAIFAGMLAAFLMGRKNGNARLRSFGLGGLIAYVVSLLLGLLLFGACFVIVRGLGG